jgi:hypothetical protein
MDKFGCERNLKKFRRLAFMASNEVERELLFAAGFPRMAAEVLALGSAPPVRCDAMIEPITALAWNDDPTSAYLDAVLVALALGRLHALIQGYLL